jgi:hypothetical protein
VALKMPRALEMLDATTRREKAGVPDEIEFATKPKIEGGVVHLAGIEQLERERHTRREELPDAAGQIRVGLADLDEPGHCLVGEQVYDFSQFRLPLHLVSPRAPD